MKRAYVYLTNMLFIIYVIIYPLIPIENKIGKITFKSDYIIYVLIFITLLGIILNKSIRKKIFSNVEEFFKSPLAWSLIGLNVVMYFSSIYALDKRVAISHSIRFTIYIFIFFIVSYMNDNKKIINFYTILILSVATFVSCGAVYEYINMRYFLHTKGEIRIASFLQNSNNLGAYIIFFIFLSVTLIFVAKGKKEKFIYGIISLIMLFSIIFCGSRNALLALILGMGIFVIFYNKKFTIVALILMSILCIIPISRNRITQVFNASQNESRIMIWKAAKYIIKDNSILGVGHNNYMTAYPKYVSKYPKQLKIRSNYIPKHPHNIFLKIQCELGIPGTIMFILFLIFSLKTIRQSLKRSKGKRQYYIIKALGMSFLIFQVMNLIDCFYDIPKIMTTMFIILGIINFYQRKMLNE